jgi:hypothetical protein
LLLLFGDFGTDYPITDQFADLILSTMDLLYLRKIIMNERANDFEKICIKCGKMYSEHRATGRFNTVILFGHECAWNPDHEFKGFVMNTLKTSGYDLLEFGYE